MDEIFDVRHADISPPHRADYSKGHRPAQSQRIADGQNKLADGERAGISPGYNRQVCGIDFHYRDIGLRVGRHDPPFVLPAVSQDHFHVHRIRDHMIVRDNVAIRRHDHAGTLPVLPARRRFLKQSERQGFVAEGLIAHHHGRGNAHDGGNHLDRRRFDLALKIGPGRDRIEA